MGVYGSVADLAPEGGVTLANAQTMAGHQPNMTLAKHNIISHKEDQDEQEGAFTLETMAVITATTNGEQHEAPVSRHKTPEMAADWKHLKKCTPMKAEKHYKLKAWPET